MSTPYWNDDWPNLNSISLALGHWTSCGDMTVTELGILCRLLFALASRGVNSQFQAASDDPTLPADDKTLRRIAKCTGKEWRLAKPEVLRVFEERDGVLRLAVPELIRITRPAGRSPIPQSVKAAALQRDGRLCTYCGDTEGPFHFDHLFPVSKGGADTQSNIVVACAGCNLSKGGRTLAEWMARR